MPDGEFYARDQKRLLATVEETEEIEEIENSPVAFEGCRCIGARSAHRDATRNFGENVNRCVRITYQCVISRGQRGPICEIERRLELSRGEETAGNLKNKIRYATSRGEPYPRHA